MTRAGARRRDRRAATPVPSAPADTLGIDDAGWARATAEAIEHLQRFLRVDTVNPPGNEMRLAVVIDGILGDAGIERTLLEPAPGRAALVARLRGTGVGGPLMLLAHLDVVGVEVSKWSCDPFGGIVRDGYVYGRGAIDDKGMLALNLQALLMLKRHVVDAGGTLTRDVIFVATSDEEAGGRWGIDWLATHHPELVRAEFALNEGGRIRIVRGRRLYAAVQCAEKVPHILSVSASGPGGHAAVPRPDNPVVRLGRALAAIGAHREPVRVLPTTRRFFGGLAAVWPDARERRAMADVASGSAVRIARGARVLAATPVFDAVLRNGISPTMLRGGVRANVIPAEVSATLNVRTLPGQSVEALARRLRRAVGDRAVTIEVSAHGHDAPPSDVRSPMFAAIAESIESLDPRTAVVPYLSTGATDSARLRRMGVKAYGLLPFPLDQGDEERMHAHDERVSVESLAYGVRLVYGVVGRMTR
jgi:acetylornithine deacetylase/succinyl-diaminopimelate desuccinylase-like protein